MTERGVSSRPLLVRLRSDRLAHLARRARGASGAVPMGRVADLGTDVDGDVAVDVDVDLDADASLDGDFEEF